MVVVSHLSLFLGDKIRGRCDSCESHLPLIKTIYFPTAPLFYIYHLADGMSITGGFSACVNLNIFSPAACLHT